MVTIWAVPLPFIMNTAGWLLTENGRQPWLVQGIQLTRDGVSPSVGRTSIIISISIFALTYAVLGAAGGWLMMRHARSPLGSADLGAAGADGSGEPGPAQVRVLMPL